MERALDAFGALKTYFHPDPSHPTFPFKLMHGSRFYNLISKLANQTAEERTAELQSDDSLTDLEKKRRRNALRKRAQRFSCKGKKIIISNILDCNGMPFDSIEDEVAAIIDSWEPTFSDKGLDMDSAKIFTKVVPKAPIVDWLIDFALFCLLLSRMCNTAPGPDGIVYGYWKHAPASVKRYLYDRYVNAFNGGDLPGDFNFSFCFVLSPKTLVALKLPLIESLRT